MMVVCRWIKLIRLTDMIKTQITHTVDKQGIIRNTFYHESPKLIRDM